MSIAAARAAPLGFVAPAGSARGREGVLRSCAVHVPHTLGFHPPQTVLFWGRPDE
jgi:hypothetical protein